MGDEHDFILHETDSAFIVESRRNGDRLLRIDRDTCGTTFIERDRSCLENVRSRRKIEGIVGIKRLLLSAYLVVVCDKELVGCLFDEHPVFKISSYDVIPFGDVDPDTPKKRLKKEARLVSMLKEVMNTPYLYFSKTIDLTKSQQRLSDDFDGLGPREDVVGSSCSGKKLISTSDKRFLWNEHLLERFLPDDGLLDFCVPVMPGYIRIHSCVKNEKTFQWALISRRSKFRAGTRLYTRGIDRDGNVANFVEIEQIIWHEGSVASFVQTRGSIPLFWSQFPDFRIWAPPKVVDPVTADSVDAFRCHVETQRQLYGNLIMVNLIDQRGREENLSNAFAGIVQETHLPYVRYEPFDFHRRCAGFQYENLRELLDTIRDSLDESGFFLRDETGQVSRRQTGVVRTNCVDSTDRTNVFQGFLGRDNFEIVLKALGVMGESESVQKNDAISSLLHNVWGENADICARQYAGSKACKNDFTKYGRRTHRGRMADAGHILVRYYSNHFYDGFRQDAINVFLGNHPVLEDCGDPSFGWNSRHASKNSVLQASFAFLVLALSYILVRKGDAGILEPTFLLMFLATVWHILGAGIQQFLSSPKYSSDTVFVHPDLV